MAAQRRLYNQPKTSIVVTASGETKELRCIIYTSFLYGCCPARVMVSVILNFRQKVLVSVRA